MAAIKKDKLEELETQYGLSEDGLTYQQRCSRITAIEKGESWDPPVTEKKSIKSISLEEHPLYGKTILFSPMMRPDAHRNIAFDEEIGYEIEVRDFSAGEHLYGKPEDVDRMVGDYEIVRRDESKKIYAKTTFPKIGTEISYTIGKNLPVPIVRGNDNSRGFVWSFPTMDIKIGDTVVRVMGLRTFIEKYLPNLLSRFSGKPVMSYVDGVTLAASIPLTRSILDEEVRRRQVDARAGIESAIF